MERTILIIVVLSILISCVSLIQSKNNVNQAKGDDKWNSVKKGIPEPKIDPLTGDNVKYLCTFKREYDDFRKIGIFWIDECGRWISQGGYDYSQWVIAWMPMPQIYMSNK